MQRDRTDETSELAEITALIQKAGLVLSGQELAALVEPYRRNREALATMRTELSLGEEPAGTFDA